VTLADTGESKVEGGRGNRKINNGPRPLFSVAPKPKQAELLVWFSELPDAAFGTLQPSWVLAARHSTSPGQYS